MTDFIDIGDHDRSFIKQVFETATAVKDDPGAYGDALQQQTLHMIFAKPSTRTRTSFEAGMTQLGGHGIYFAVEQSQMSRGETEKDTAKVLSRYVDGIMARLFDHEHVAALAEHADVPVINGLTDKLHPCQALADLFTMREHGIAPGTGRVVYVGDGNNVAHSLVQICSLFDMDVTVACPAGYEPDDDIVVAARDRSTGAVDIVHDPADAVQDADVVYTDVWVSMGDENEAERREAFAPFQVDAALMDRTDGAVFMHPLPAHRGEEVTSAVLDSDTSIVYDQAENRLHTQKALLVELLGQ